MLTSLVNSLANGLVQSIGQRNPSANPLVARFNPIGEAPQEKLSLSPRAARLVAGGEVGDELIADARSATAALLQSANGMIHKALNDMRRDVAGLLKSFGFAAEVANEFARSFTDPVLAALKSGADFSATITMVAAQQQTVLTGGHASQSFALVAKSLAIEVNHSTGRVSVSVVGVSIESHVGVNFGSSDLRVADFRGTPVAVGSHIAQVASALEALQAITRAAKVEDAKEADGTEEVEIDHDAVAELLTAEPADDDDDGEDEAASQAFQATAGAFVSSFATAFRILSIESFQTTLGEFVTRVRLDAASPLDPSFANAASTDAEDENRAPSFDETA